VDAELREQALGVMPSSVSADAQSNGNLLRPKTSADELRNCRFAWAEPRK
jgi:hypothetical protein